MCLKMRVRTRQEKFGFRPITLVAFREVQYLQPRNARHCFSSKRLANSESGQRLRFQQVFGEANSPEILRGTQYILKPRRRIGFAGIRNYPPSWVEAISLPAHTVSGSTVAVGASRRSFYWSLEAACRSGSREHQGGGQLDWPPPFFCIVRRLHRASPAIAPIASSFASLR